MLSKVDVELGIFWLEEQSSDDYTTSKFALKCGLFKYFDQEFITVPTIVKKFQTRFR